jgi:uncharacterized protein (DUF1501 family)
MKITRRDLIRQSCCAAAALGTASSFSRFGLIHALAQSPASYQALVCIFLFGGNDANNMLIPTDTAGYANYLKYRVAVANGGLALDQSTLLPIASKTAQNGQTSFGLHPNLPEVEALFTSGRLAFLANVGPLAQPLTRTQYLAPDPPVPANLFSHADQQQQWQTLELDGFYKTGWAGRLADNINGSLNSGSLFPPITSVAGSAIFGTGQQTQPYAIIPGTTPGLSGFDSSAAGTARLQALQQLLTFDTGVSLIQSASSITSNSLADSKTLSAALASATPLATVFPATSLGAQLKQVAQLLSVRSALSLNRQVFFCSLGGFDTHSNQIATQQSLFSQLSPAMNAFYNATVELNLAQQVTTFTMSDFSRTYQPASDGGSDHAWGSVQMIMGGAVVGGDIYGTLPVFAPGGPSDVGSNGRWIPTTPIDQYGATLAKWFGVPAGDFAAIFPNLANFPTQTLTFLG